MKTRMTLRDKVRAEGNRTERFVEGSSVEAVAHLAGQLSCAGTGIGIDRGSGTEQLVGQRREKWGTR